MKWFNNTNITNNTQATDPVNIPVPNNTPDSTPSSTPDSTPKDRLAADCERVKQELLSKVKDDLDNEDIVMIKGDKNESENTQGIDQKNTQDIDQENNQDENTESESESDEEQVTSTESIRVPSVKIMSNIVYDEENSVYVLIRNHRGIGYLTTYEQALNKMHELASELLEEYYVNDPVMLCEIRLTRDRNTVFIMEQSRLFGFLFNYSKIRDELKVVKIPRIMATKNEQENKEENKE